MNFLFYPFNTGKRFVLLVRRICPHVHFFECQSTMIWTKFRDESCLFLVLIPFYSILSFAFYIPLQTDEHEQGCNFELEVVDPMGFLYGKARY